LAEHRGRTKGQGNRVGCMHLQPRRLRLLMLRNYVGAPPSFRRSLIDANVTPHGSSPQISDGKQSSPPIPDSKMCTEMARSSTPFSVLTVHAKEEALSELSIILAVLRKDAVHTSPPKHDARGRVESTRDPLVGAGACRKPLRLLHHFVASSRLACAVPQARGVSTGACCCQLLCRALIQAGPICAYQI
jgi:hypothetical protein